MPDADPADFPLLTGVIPGLNVTPANAAAGTLQLLGRWFPVGQPNVSVSQLLPGGAPVRASWSGSMILGSFTGTGATCNLQVSGSCTGMGSVCHFRLHRAPSWVLQSLCERQGSGLIRGTGTTCNFRADSSLAGTGSYTVVSQSP